MTKTLIITGLLVLLVACKPEPSGKEPSSQADLARSVLLDAKLLSFTGNDLVTDGGSIIYIFRTEKDERLDIFLKVQFDDNHRHLDVTNSSQPVQIRLERFMRDDMYTIERSSKEENHLLELINQSTGEECDPAYSKIRTNLIKIIEDRNFLWSLTSPKLRITKKRSKSGKGECLAPPPHTTKHAAPHLAVRKTPPPD